MLKAAPSAAVVDDAITWAEHEPALADRVVTRVGSLSRVVADRLLDNDHVENVVDRASGYLSRRLTDVVEDLDTADHTGVPVEQALALADEEAARVLRRHRRLLAVQGATTGAASINIALAAATVAADVVASSLGLVRAAAETLAAYGEPAHGLGHLALGVVDLAGLDDVQGRRACLRRLVERPDDSEPERVAGVVADQAGTRLLNETIEALLRRRVRRSALRAVPVLGAAVGGATSATMATRTCTAAQHVGRLRLLRRCDPLAPSPAAAL